MNVMGCMEGQGQKVPSSQGPAEKAVPCSQLATGSQVAGVSMWIRIAFRL